MNVKNNSFRNIGIITIALVVFVIFVFVDPIPEGINENPVINAAILGFGIMVIVIVLPTFFKFEDAKNFYGAGKAFRINDIDMMDGIEFEKYLEKVFKIMGFKVTRTKASGDFGVDLIIDSKKDKIAIQAKRYSENVSNKAVQEVFAGMRHYNANKGWVIASSGFTKSAYQQAESCNVKLVDRKGLEKILTDEFKAISKFEQPPKGIEKLWTKSGVALLILGIIGLEIIGVVPLLNYK